jgi:hypothetical protein
VTALMVVLGRILLGRRRLLIVVLLLLHHVPRGCCP